MGLLTETNEQYYGGQQAFIGNAAQSIFRWTGDTPLVGSTNASFPNFEVTVNNVVLTEVDPPPALPPAGAGEYYYGLNANQITLGFVPAFGDVIVIKLLDDAKWANFGGYAYITIEDIVNNFLVAYVGPGKLISDVKRTDVIFHAKRGLQEFSYDTLKSIKSQELTIPPSLSLIIPQDYVNYVKLSYIDNAGIKHIIYPTTLTTNPFTVPIQDNDGVPTQDSLGTNLESTSLINERWENNNLFNNNLNQQNSLLFDYSNWYMYRYGRRYGLAPEVAQSNGWFTIDEREGKFSFSSNLAGQLIILEYISDGLASDLDTKVPKMAEEAMYMHLVYSILAGRSGVQEYVVRRYKIDRRAALRNAKIRLSNIKLEEFTQIMRGKSKIIKH
jgi:hypothetical protein